jgi:hypothetical protein
MDTGYSGNFSNEEALLRAITEQHLKAFGLDPTKVKINIVRPEGRGLGLSFQVSYSTRTGLIRIRPPLRKEYANSADVDEYVHLQTRQRLFMTPEQARREAGWRLIV